MKKLANRAPKIKAFQVMALLAKAQAMEESGRDIIHLEVGEPDFATPEAVVNAGIQALAQNKTRYTAATGLPELRQAIAQHYQTHFGVAVDYERILITVGASGAIQLACSVLFNPGDGVLLADPGYPCNHNILHLLGACPQPVAVGPESAFQLTADKVVQQWQKNTCGVWLASPSNPTGTAVQPLAMQAIYDQVVARDGVLLVDEIYQGLVYDQTPATALSLSGAEDNLFVINSFSKYFTMTGWRLGWLVAPADYVPYLDRLAQNLFLAPPTVAQYAALEALKPANRSVFEAQRLTLAQRRDYLLEELPKLGIQVPCPPHGAFYLYCDVSQITDDSFAFCSALLEQQGVAITPGLDFGAARANQFVRIAYTAEIERLEQALQRIRQFIEAL